MSEASAGRTQETSRYLAMVSYGLLFASAFLAGIPAVIALVIAYTQRDQSPPEVRRHFNFQIRIFWVAMVLTLVASGCLLGALFAGLSDFFAYNRIENFLGETTVDIDLSHLTLTGPFMALGVASAVSFLLLALWILVAPLVGFIRLASTPTMGHSPAP